MAKLNVARQNAQAIMPTAATMGNAEHTENY